MLLKRFKEDKEIMEIEMEAADKLVEKATDIAETATNQFIEKLKSHVKHAKQRGHLEVLKRKG